MRPEPAPLRAASALPRTVRAVAAAYDHVAGKYDGTYQDPLHRAEDRWLARWLRRRLPDDRPDLLTVDLGCGTGWLLDQLPDLDPYLGLDISPGMLEVARRKHPGRRFAEADMAEIGQLPTASCAAVVSTFGSLNYHPRPAQVLAAAYRVLAPGGRLLLLTYGPRAPHREVFNGTRPHPPRRRFDPTSLRWLVEGVGLQVVELHGFRRPGRPLLPPVVGVPAEQLLLPACRAAYLLVHGSRR